MRKVYFICFTACFITANVVCTKPVIDNPASPGNHESSQDVSTAIVNKTITYIIPKGEQFCTPNPLSFTSKNKLTFNAVFDSSCIYSTVDPKNQNDINKLYGFSDCGTHHLINSARVGWRWSNDSLRLFAFVHNDGNMLFKEITTAQIGSVINCVISCSTDQYTFTVNGKTAQLPRHCSGRYTRYRLFPYFGGDEVAPHRIRIKITELSN